MEAMHQKERHAVVVLLLILTAFAMVQPCTAKSGAQHVRVVNGLSNANLFVRCKSKDNNLGDHDLVPGDEFKWDFDFNLWGTTLFWCYLAKPGANVSFEAFWIEKHSNWLHLRCFKYNCIWIAKDDGIYLRNNLDNIDELVHKWNNKT